MKNILLIVPVLLLIAFSSNSCRKADCGSTCSTGSGHITFTACGTQYDYNCFQSARAVDANHYALTFNSCSNTGCTLTLTLGYFSQISASSLPVTISASPSEPDVALTSSCPTGTTGSTQQGLIVQITSYSGGMLAGTISGTTNNCTITDGSFSLTVPSNILGTGTGNASGCNTGYYIDVNINGQTANMTCGGLLTTLNGVAVYGYECPSGVSPDMGINFQIENYSGLSNGTAGYGFAITCSPCQFTAYSSAGVTSSLTTIQATVTFTSVTATTVQGTISGNCAGAAEPYQTSVPITGTFSIPAP